MPELEDGINGVLYSVYILVLQASTRKTHRNIWNARIYTVCSSVSYNKHCTRTVLLCLTKGTLTLRGLYSETTAGLQSAPRLESNCPPLAFFPPHLICQKSQP